MEVEGCSLRPALPACCHKEATEPTAKQLNDASWTVDAYDCALFLLLSSENITAVHDFPIAAALLSAALSERVLLQIESRVHTEPSNHRESFCTWLSKGMKQRRQACKLVGCLITVLSTG